MAEERDLELVGGAGVGGSSGVVAGDRDLELVAAAAGQQPAKPISLIRLIFACMVAGGVQYGWALQLSLLTPYVQVGILLFIYAHLLTSLFSRDVNFRETLLKINIALCRRWDYLMHSLPLCGSVALLQASW